MARRSARMMAKITGSVSSMSSKRCLSSFTAAATVPRAASFALLKQLIESYGVSGHEAPVRELVKSLLPAWAIMCAGVAVFGTFSGLVASWFLSSPATGHEGELAEIKRMLSELQARDTALTAGYGIGGAAQRGPEEGRSQQPNPVRVVA